MSGGDPPSPCIALCVLDPATGYCRGCFRTLNEISDWPSATGEKKRNILLAIDARRRQAAGRR